MAFRYRRWQRSSAGFRRRKTAGFFRRRFGYFFCFGLGLLALGLGSFFFLWGSGPSGGAACAFTFCSLEDLGAPEAVGASSFGRARITVHISAIVPGPLGAGARGTPVLGALQDQALIYWNSAAGEAARLLFRPPAVVVGPLQENVEVLGVSA